MKHISSTIVFEAVIVLNALTAQPITVAVPQVRALTNLYDFRQLLEPLSLSTSTRNVCKTAPVIPLPLPNIQTHINPHPDHSFNQQVLIDTTPLPDSVPKVPEIGASSAPLLSASFFIGDRCKAFNDDYMKCKTDSHGKGEIECMKEGRKVTRCAASV